MKEFIVPAVLTLLLTFSQLRCIEAERMTCTKFTASVSVLIWENINFVFITFRVNCYSSPVLLRLRSSSLF